MQVLSVVTKLLLSVPLIPFIVIGVAGILIYLIACGLVVAAFTPLVSLITGRNMWEVFKYGMMQV